VCQLLRIISFTVTQLPAPNYHCRTGEPTAIKPMPRNWTGHLLVDVGQQATKGCGDLVFSSHTIFILAWVLTYNDFGGRPALKALAWAGVVAMSICIVASRKHYTLDVVIAWYTVPLIYWTLQR
jgi:hypothetical protein